MIKRYFGNFAFSQKTKSKVEFYHLGKQLHYLSTVFPRNCFR